MDEGPRYAQSTATQKEGTRTRGETRECARNARGPGSRALALDRVCRQRSTNAFSHRGSRERVQPFGEGGGRAPPSRRARRKTKRRGGLLLSRSISLVIRTLDRARTDRPGEYRRIRRVKFYRKYFSVKTKIFTEALDGGNESHLGLELLF